MRTSHILRRPLIVLVLLALSACSPATSAGTTDGISALAYNPKEDNSAAYSGATPQPVSALLAQARAKIKHVVIIMQENRSFDHYFGTFPGADGIPMKDGVPTVCSVQPGKGECVKPYHDPSDVNYGGPHTHAAFRTSVDDGKMDGYVMAFLAEHHVPCSGTDPNQPDCVQGGNGRDVMGWHDAREIPNYWAYAENFVLQDHMFEPSSSWSLPDHLFMVSGWSATCSSANDPMSCISDLGSPGKTVLTDANPELYAWTDITYLMYKNNVSWAYYLSEGQNPDCADGEMTCPPQDLKISVPGIWNPLPYFTTVHQNNQLGNIQTTDKFYAALKNGTLPSVSWIIPSGKYSEHPTASIREGQAYVTGLINAVMNSPEWNSTAIFISWDDWGGFYDHVLPPVVDANGYGLRVPGMLVSAYARRGYIDHQVLSHDAYLVFIEDLFLGNLRLDPRTDGRPDSRLSVRENVPVLGNLLSEFDFSQTPLPPLILPVDPPPGPASIPGS